METLAPPRVLEGEQRSWLERIPVAYWVAAIFLLIELRFGALALP